MILLHTFDRKNYDESWKRCVRDAVRAIIIKDGKIAMVHSEAKGYYKFPGGGAELDEDHRATLARETLEEIGLHVKEVTGELGMIKEVRKGLYGQEIFEHNSYYYFATVGDEISKVELDYYEADLGYHLVWTTLKEAYDADIEKAKDHHTDFLYREACVLKFLMDNMNE
jgi:8-oxo-dGTP pyrophosphatase MutT (NUDIX family)